MKEIERSELTAHAHQVLERRTDAVSAAVDRVERARRFWRANANLAYTQIRAALKSMATGIERCMYCEDSAGTDIDHFWPLALYPERAFEWTNYLLACSHCNSNQKRDQFPVDLLGDALLIDPTSMDPKVHLVLAPTTGEFAHKTVQGGESIRVFGLNRRTLSQGRLDAWSALGVLIRAYAAARDDANVARADEILGVIHRHPFSGVLESLLELATSPQGHVLLDAEVIAAAHAHPELAP
jgi:hypothetical protein